MSNLKKLGERLKKARSSMSYSQSDIAKKLGVQRELISYYETGTREIPLSALTTLANLYGTTLNYFFNESTQEEPNLEIAYRKVELSEDDIEKIEWVKQFATNLYELEKL